jgi:hypothetical protein
MRKTILDNRKGKLYRGIPWWIFTASWAFFILSILILTAMIILNDSIVNLRFRYVIVDHNVNVTNSRHPGAFGIFIVVSNFIILLALIFFTIKVWKFGDRIINYSLIGMSVIMFIYTLIHCLGILFNVMPLVPIFSTYVYNGEDDWKLEYTLQPFLYVEMCFQILNTSIIGSVNIYYFLYYRKL